MAKRGKQRGANKSVWDRVMMQAAKARTQFEKKMGRLAKPLMKEIQSMEKSLEAKRAQLSAYVGGTSHAVGSKKRGPKVGSKGKGKATAKLPANAAKIKSEILTALKAGNVNLVTLRKNISPNVGAVLKVLKKDGAIEKVGKAKGSNPTYKLKAA